MKVIHKQITYEIENIEEIDKIIKEQPDEWEAHNRSDIYKNVHGKMQVEIYYRLRDK